MIVFRIFLISCILTCLAFGQTRSAKNAYEQIDLKEIAGRPTEYQGRLVTITADVVSVNADYRSLDVFDSSTKTLIGVSLSQLSKTQRQMLVLEAVHRVSVFGRIEMKNSRPVIKADNVLPLATSLVARQ